MVRARTQDNLAASFRIEGVLRELAGNPDSGISRHPGDFFRPCGSPRIGGILVILAPNARETSTFYPILSQQNIVNRGHQVPVNLAYWYPPVNGASTHGATFVFPGYQVKAGQGNFSAFSAFLIEAELGVYPLHL